MWAVIGCLFIEGTNSCSAVDFTRKPNPTEGYPFHFWKRGCHYNEWRREGSLKRTIDNREYFMMLRLLNCLFKIHALKNFPNITFIKTNGIKFCLVNQLFSSNIRILIGYYYYFCYCYYYCIILLLYFTMAS